MVIIIQWTLKPFFNGVYIGQTIFDQCFCSIIATISTAADKNNWCIAASFATDTTK